MSFLNKLFGSKENSANDENLIEIEQDKFVDNSDPNEKPANIVTITYSTSFPIDAIYAFVKKDMENDGYNDALCCPDNSYKERKMKIIRNELKNIFDQVNLRYIDLLKRLDAQIASSTEQGLSGRSKQFAIQKELMQEHIEKLKQLEEDFNNNKETMTGMLESYEMGFSRGVSFQINDITAWNKN
ncbi:MAG: hypothetical protein J6Q59_07895 [Paludibacteraceae bacterium]|jgi:hypothetical protein|nr:hypothetical protein [Paludibacteraceae bacterium]